MKKHVGVPGGWCALLVLPLAAQAALIDSGFVENTGNATAVIFSTTVADAGATWLQMRFDLVQLSGNEAVGTGAYLRITSAADGAVQTMHTSHVAQWQNKSAFFNGDEVQIELVAHPGTGLNRVMINDPMSGPENAGGGFPVSAVAPCLDRRVLSGDPRVARTISSAGSPICSAFIIDDAAHCLITAGHCAGTLFMVEFNVPFSAASGAVVHPPPEDQYVVDLSSVQWHDDGFGVIGDDWCYFGCFPNSTTGLTPFQTQGAFFELVSTLPPSSGQTVRATGYGAVSSPVSKLWNRVQKTHAGEYYNHSVTQTWIEYRVDITKGNSGSPVYLEDTCEVIGIATDIACHVVTGIPSADGTAVTNPGLRAAIANPRGVCVPDCNENSIPDGCDIDCGTIDGPCNVPDCGGSADCSGNGIPDECEPDCNANLVPDSCDILAGTSDDCTGDGVPDECEADCNSNTEPDSCDIGTGVSDDCNCNLVPDECDIATCLPGDLLCGDCNENGVPDGCESGDCNHNGLLDECECIRADMNGDNRVDGMDIQPFVDCVLSSGDFAGLCYCADMDRNHVLDVDDMPCFVNALLGIDACDITNPCPATGALAFGRSGTDCNQNGRDDTLDIFHKTSADCNKNGLPDECEIDESSQASGGPFYCTENCDSDCNDNGVPDMCEVDCNANGLPDDCDIAGQIDSDLNANGIPDGCEPDCNGNGVPDALDMDPTDPDGNNLVSPDCNANGIPDECEEDCNGNGVPDECDVDPNDPDGNGQVSADCNFNGWPDECDLALSQPFGSLDCNENGIPDECDIAACQNASTCDDCNGNDVPDACDIAAGISQDTNLNGIPDECEGGQQQQHSGVFSCEHTEQRALDEFVDWCLNQDWGPDSGCSGREQFQSWVDKKTELGLPLDQQD